MKQYNIYSGKKGSLRYAYTTLAESQEEALHIAQDEMYAEYAEIPNNLTWDAAIHEVTQYVKNNGKQPEEIISEATAIYNSYRENWGEYNAVLTSEDSIPLNDLILDYVLSNNEGEASGARN